MPKLLTLDEQKPYLAEHLPYEAHMLKHAYERLDTCDKPGVDLNVLLEEFCLHARNLKLFLTNDDGIRACDFVPSFKERVGDLGPDFDLINRSMSHLTRDRLKGRKFSIEHAKRVYAWITEGIEKFINALGPGQREFWAVGIKVTHDR